MLPHMALDKLPEPVRAHDMSSRRGLARPHERRRRHGHRRRRRDPRPRRPQGRLSRHLPGQKGPGHPQRRRLFADHLRAWKRRRPPPSPVTGSIPYGKADLLLGIDILEAARAIDPREQFRVASRSTPPPWSTRTSRRPSTLLGGRILIPRPCASRSSSTAIRAQLRQESLGDLRAAAGQQAVRQHHDARRGLSARADSGVGAQHRLGDQGHHPPRAPPQSQGLQHRPQAGAGAARAARKPEPETWEQLLTNKIAHPAQDALVRQRIGARSLECWSHRP
jgi:hypothetical protein